MSTKIYDGLRMTDIPTLNVLRTRIQKLRTQAYEIIERLVLQRVAENCSKYVDQIALGKKVYALTSSYDMSILGAVINTVEERHVAVEKTKRRDPECDFHFEICIIPIKDKVLILPYTEQIELMNLIKNQKYIKSYGYWNNTDPDDEVSDEEWEQREEDWNAALTGIGIPVENGFTAQLHPPYLYVGFHPPKAKILKYMPEYKNRVRRQAFELAWSTMIKRLIKAEKKKKNGRDEMNCYMKASSNVKDTPEGRALLKETTKFVRSRIPKIITEKHLDQKLKLQKKEVPK
jgi:hypothetical protein